MKPLLKSPLPPQPYQKNWQKKRLRPESPNLISQVSGNQSDGFILFQRKKYIIEK